jgi:filamentous hemagglutinin family protein
MRKLCIRCKSPFCAMLVAGCCLAPQVHAAGPGPHGIRTDGSVGPAATSLQGPHYLIPQNLGALSGKNLFYSFQYLSVANGESAVFSTTTPGLQNVISRVTGGYASTIAGSLELQSLSARPNFFFINPSGIIFTAGATINVPAGFYVSSADYLRFPDGRFYADSGKSSTFSASSPDAFGFLGAARASAVSIEGALLHAGANGEGEFQVAAGDVRLTGNGSVAGVQNGTGDVRVVAIGKQAVEVPLSGSFATSDGSIEISQGGAISTSGGATGPSGGIYVSGGSLSIDGAGVGTSNDIDQTGLTSLAGDAGASPISVEVAEGLTINDTGAIKALTRGAGHGASVSVHAGTLSVDGGVSADLTGIRTYSEQGAAGNVGDVLVEVGGSVELANAGQIGSYSAGIGTGGAVSVKAGELGISGGSFLTTGNTGINSNAFSVGDAGPITIIADSLFIDGGDSFYVAGISSATSSSVSGKAGRAGNVSVSVGTDTTVQIGGQVSSITYGAGAAGEVMLHTKRLIIDGEGVVPTGIFSNAIGNPASSSASGNAGNVLVVVDDTATMLLGGTVGSDTYASGRAGDVTVTAGSLLLSDSEGLFPTGIRSQAHRSSSGNAGNVSVTVIDAATLLLGGAVSSGTSGSGAAGDVTVTAGSLLMDGQGLFPTGIASEVQGRSSGRAGNVSVTVADTAKMLAGGAVESGTLGSGSPGSVIVHTGSLWIDGETSAIPTGVFSDSSGIGAKAGNIMVKVSGAATLLDGGYIRSETFGSDAAGDVAVTADSLMMNGDGGLTGISSESRTGSSGAAGDVSVTISGPATLLAGGLISSVSVGSGAPGAVIFASGSLRVDGEASQAPTGFYSSTSSPTAQAGEISVTIADEAVIRSGGVISAETTDSGAGGGVVVTAGSLLVDGEGEATLTGITSGATPGSTGNGGNVLVQVRGPVNLQNGGEISSNSVGSGNAGDVTVKAGTLVVDRGDSIEYTGISSDVVRDETGNGGTGHGGNVTVNVENAATVRNGGLISADTSGIGNAGNVSVSAGTLLVDGNNLSSLDGKPQLTGISSGSVADFSGAAGNVSVTTPSDGAVRLINGGAINGESESIFAGHPGSVSIDTGLLALQGGKITIDDHAVIFGPAKTTTPLLNIHARSIDLQHGEISASSFEDADASAIRISYEQLMRLESSTISTSANQGNGGTVQIFGNGVLRLNRSQIETSVVGLSGNGGDIRIDVPFLILESGAIQANTNAATGSGGSVTIATQALIPSFEQFIRGGEPVPFVPSLLGLNVVQAATPTGVNGALEGTAPTLDVGNALLRLAGLPARPPSFGRTLCGSSRGNSLAIAGRGGLPTGPDGPIWLDDASPDRWSWQGAETSGSELVAYVDGTGSVTCRAQQDCCARR